MKKPLPPPAPSTLRLKTPEDPKYVPWLEKELPNYQSAVEYVSFFIENRALMGDVDTNDMWAEFKMNVCMHMRDGLDRDGQH